MLFHHALTMFGETIVLVRGINGCEMMATLLGTELTNPLLQMRWFMRNASTDIPWYYKEVVDLLFLALFTFIRIGLGSVYLVFYLSHPVPDVIAQGGALAIYLVGWVFWAGLLRYAWRKYVLRVVYPSKSSKSSCYGEKESKSQAISEDLANNHVNCSSTMGDFVDQVVQDQKAQNKVSGLGNSEVHVECRHRTILTEEAHTV